MDWTDDAAEGMDVEASMGAGKWWSAPGSDKGGIALFVADA